MLQRGVHSRLSVQTKLYFHHQKKQNNFDSHEIFIQMQAAHAAKVFSLKTFWLKKRTGGHNDTFCKCKQTILAIS